MKRDFDDLAKKVHAATAEGMAASLSYPNDGGSANLDHVCIYGLKGVRESSLMAAGIDCRKATGMPGVFRLVAPFPGQGNQRVAGVEAMAASLRKAGVDCYVHSQMD